MKRLLLASISLMFMVSMTPSLKAQSIEEVKKKPKVVVAFNSPLDETLAEGSTFNMTVGLQDVTNLEKFTMEFSYDPEQIDIKSMKSNYQVVGYSSKETSTITDFDAPYGKAKLANYHLDKTTSKTTFTGTDKILNVVVKATSEHKVTLDNTDFKFDIISEGKDVSYDLVLKNTNEVIQEPQPDDTNKEPSDKTDDSTKGDDSSKEPSDTTDDSNKEPSGDSTNGDDSNKEPSDSTNPSDTTDDKNKDVVNPSDTTNNKSQDSTTTTNGSNTTTDGVDKSLLASDSGSDNWVPVKTSDGKTNKLIISSAVVFICLVSSFCVFLGNKHKLRRLRLFNRYKVSK